MGTTYIYPPVSVTTLPPVGGATAANQLTQITEAQTTNTTLTNTYNELVTTGNEANTNALVMIDYTGSKTETAPATDTASSGLNGRLQRIAQRLTSLIALFPTSLGSKADASSFSTTSSTEDKAQIGALTETAPATDTASSGLNGRLQRIAQRLTSLIALFPATLGQKTMANSFAVTIASDQAAFPVTTSATVDITASGNITTQNLVPAGTATAGSAVELTLNNIGTVAVQVTGTYTGALSAQATIDGTNWVTLSAIQNCNTGALSGTIASAAVGIFQFETSSFNKVRITALAAVTGTAVVSLRGASRQGLIGLDSPVPAGTNVIGALSANQSVNVTQVSGTTLSVGVGSPANGLRIARASVAGTITSAQIAVGITAVRATVAGTAPNASRVRLSVKPSVNNTGRIFIGPSTVTTANGLEIIGPDRLDFEFDAGDYYLISDTASQVVEVLEKV